MIVDRNGRPIVSQGKVVELDPRGRKGALLTAPAGEPTYLRIDGYRDAMALPAGTQWHLVPEWLYQHLLADQARMAARLAELGEDTEHSTEGLANEIMSAMLAREVQGIH